jgi:hypothetical protein
MAQVKVEFVLKGGDKVVTTNETIIKQLIEQGAQYKVLEGNVQELITSQEQQNTSTQELTKSYQEVLAEYKANEKELKALAIAGDTTSERYQELVQSVGSARAALEDVNKEANINKGAFDATIGSLGGAAAGFSAIQGALGLVGVESDNVQKALLKVQSALALSQGLDQFQKAIPAFQNLTGIIGKNLVAAFGSLRTAIIATGIGAAAVAIGLIVAYWEDIKKLIEVTTPSIEEQLDVIIAKREELKQTQDILELQLENYELQNRETKELRQSIIDNLNLQIESLKTELLRTEELKKQKQEQQSSLTFWQKTKLAVAGIFGVQAQIGVILDKVKEDQKETQKIDNDILNIRKQILQTENSILKIQNDGTKKSIDQQKKVADARSANARLSIQLLEDGLRKSLELNELERNERIKNSKQSGEEIKKIDLLFDRERRKIIKEFYKDYKKEVDDFYLDFGELTTGAFQFEEKKLKENLDQRIASLKNYQKEVLDLTDKNDKNYQFIVNKTNEQLKVAQEVADRTLIEFRRNTIINGYNTLIELEETLSGNRLDTLKKGLGIGETITKLSIDNFRLEYEEKRKIQEQALLNATQADAANQFERVLKAKEADELTTQGQRDLYEKIQKIREDNKDNESKQNDEISKEKEIFYKNETDRVKNYYSELSKLQQEQLEKDILYAIKQKSFSKEIENIDKESNKKSLDEQIKYYNDLNGISTKNVEKRKKQEANISKKFEKDELERQKKLLDQKLAAAEKAFGKESEEYKQLQLEKAKLEKQFTEASVKQIKLISDRNAQFVQQLISLVAEVGATLDSFYELDAARTNAFYDEEVRKNTEANNNEINNYALTQEEKQNINQRYAL